MVSAFCALAACGYEPALAPGGSAETLRGSIVIADPSDVEGFALVRALEERLGQAQSPSYRLDANIRIADEGVGILPDQTITRFQVSGIVDYELSALDTGERVSSGRVANFTSYSATSTTVATTAAQRDAEQRLMVTLAEQIYEELVLTQPEWSQ